MLPLFCAFHCPHHVCNRRLRYAKLTLSASTLAYLRDNGPSLSSRRLYRKISNLLRCHLSVSCSRHWRLDFLLVNQETADQDVASLPLHQRSGRLHAGSPRTREKKKSQRWNKKRYLAKYSVADPTLLTRRTRLEEDEKDQSTRFSAYTCTCRTTKMPWRSGSPDP